MKAFLPRLRRDEGGNAAIEFALILPLLLFMIIGAADVAMSVHARLQLQSAVNAGLQHAMLTQGRNIEQTRTIVQHELGSTTAQVQVRHLCNCETSGTCSTSCTAATRDHVEVQVTTQSDHLLLPDIQLQSLVRIYTGIAT